MTDEDAGKECPLCGPECLGGAAHSARSEDGAARAVRGMETLEMLERALAYEYAASLIRSSCCQQTFPGDAAVWFDTRQVDRPAKMAMLRAERYLEARGLLERHPRLRALVQVREERL